MKRLMMAAAVAAVTAMCAGDALAQIRATNDVWSAEIRVTKTATRVRLNAVNVSVRPQGGYAVVLQWEWLDEAGSVVNRGVTRYTEAEITAALAEKGKTIDAVRQLFLEVAAAKAVGP